MKQLGKVIERCKKDLKRPVNMYCRVEYFGMIVNEFCEKKRKIVKDMGFAGLIGLVDKQLPRELCNWLVHWVPGIPKGHLLVPKKVVDDTAQHYLERVVARFSSTTPRNVKGVLRKNLVDDVAAPLDDVI
uniref:Uncharacterized protein n=1 Tax=Chenopodium quinoa TaxID=63459 RepID=A0A803MP88_CHEQI